MAIVRNSPYPDIGGPEVFFRDYKNWKPITLPSGEVVYELPGHPERVFVPSLSNASGNVVLRPNPVGEIAKQKEAENIAKKQQDQQSFNQSPAGQIVPVAAGTVGLIAANQFGAFGKGGNSATDQVAAEILRQRAGLPPTGGQAAQPVVPTTQSQAAAQGATAAPGGTFSDSAPTGTGTLGEPTGNFSGTMADGTPGTLMPDGTVATDTLPQGATVQQDGSIISAENGAIIGRVTNGAIGAYQIYQGAQDFKKDKAGGSLGIASGAANVATALGSEYGATAAPYLMAAKGGYDGYQAFQRGGEGIRTAGTELGAGIGTMILPGIGTVAGAAIGNAAGYALDRFAPSLFHKTTRQEAQNHTHDLLKEGQDDPNYQAYVQGMREQFNKAPEDSKVFAGKYESWDEYKKGGLEAGDLTGVYGNIKTYGPAWANLTQDQRQAVTQANIESGLYQSKKGEVEITDEVKAKENFDNVMKGFDVGVKTGAQAVDPKMQPLAPGQSPLAVAAASGALTPYTDPRRTGSRSPGIGLDGRRIVY